MYGVFSAWVTSWARYWLQEAIDLVGDDFVYTDTDSVKFIGDHSEDFAKLNARIQKISKANHAYAVDRKGRTHYTGVYEYEETYSRFVTLGAKKYVVEHDDDHLFKDSNGKLHKLECTVAGVGKTVGTQELEDAGGLENFGVGFVFEKGGGLAVAYHDDYYKEIAVEGRVIPVHDNIYLYDDHYKVKFTNDYDDLLQFISESGAKKSSNFS